ncbi:regulator of chromosome condensation domain-containing protein [Cavenderia fasciculata]|uniref:Regulator of chromosome condensation domain-containing protein n=1 Tax=Cavenderia fasciculata TaxID=261658 RepID=F4QBH4_CACFS|nr:regulator of chromosome condensation domain-containing protein [Cavenderia fasciculata]EGG14946.1 regulator of chromosome condensation domain-containing protein [Cavenderia fasciculata]|eukprot:XP_004351462.1 regulator of chromosome condensation domain-containing protein [Cavenderia fasciculata]
MIPVVASNGNHSPKLNNIGQSYHHHHHHHTTNNIGGGVLYLWGEKYTTKPSFCSSIPNIQSIHCGFNHTLVLTEQGQVYSFGDNRNQQLGLSNESILEQFNQNAISSSSCGASSSPSSLSSLSLSSSTSFRSSMNLRNSNTNSSSPFAHSSIPLLISGVFNGLKVKMVASGGCFSAAVLENGLLYTWGTLDDIGKSTTILPTKVDLIKGVTSVSVGLNHIAVVAESNTPTEKRAVYTWGSNKRGQLGVLGDSITNAPRKVTLGAKALSVCCGEEFTAAIVEGNEVFVWGNNKGRQICPNNTDETISIPVKPFLGRDIVELSCSRNYIVARTGAGNLYCWGNNESVCRIADSSTMVQFPQKIKQISAGVSHVLALSEKGEVYTWGQGEDGQLGGGDVHKKSMTTNFKKISHLENRQVLYVVAWGRCSGAVVEPGNSRVEVAETMRRAENNKSIAPLYVRRLTHFIRGDSSKLEGIFRLSGSKARVDELERRLESNEEFSMSKYEAFDAADVLKRYFKNLPEPLLVQSLCNQYEKDILNCSDLNLQKRLVMEWISQLPRENRELLIYLLSFLDEIVHTQLEHQKANAMASKNLALVFAPNLLTKGEIGNDEIIEIMINMFNEIIGAHSSLETSIIIDHIQDGIKGARKIPYTIDLWKRCKNTRESATKAFLEPQVLIEIVDQIVLDLTLASNMQSPLSLSNNIINSNSKSTSSLLNTVSPLQSPKHRSTSISIVNPTNNNGATNNNAFNKNIVNPIFFGSLSSPTLSSSISNLPLPGALSSSSSSIPPNSTLAEYRDVLLLFLSPILQPTNILKVLPSMSQIQDVNNLFIQLLLLNKLVKTLNYDIYQKVLNEINNIKTIDSTTTFQDSIIETCNSFIHLTSEILLIETNQNIWKGITNNSKIYLSNIMEYFNWWNNYLQKSMSDLEDKILRSKKDFDKVENEKMKNEKLLATNSKAQSSFTTTQTTTTTTTINVDELKNEFERWTLMNQSKTIAEKTENFKIQMEKLEWEKQVLQLECNKFKPHFNSVKDFVDSSIKSFDQYLDHLEQQKQQCQLTFSQYCGSFFDTIFKFQNDQPDNISNKLSETIHALSREWNSHPHHLVSLEIETKLNSIKKQLK